MEKVGAEYLRVVRQNFLDLKKLGDRTFAQLPDADFYAQPDRESNSIAVVIRHLHGNMASRFTDFLTTDGEKPGRNRDGEFESANQSRDELVERWETGWQIVMKALDSLDEADLLRTVLIRNQPLSVIEALNRQVSHYGYHVGQIVFLAKHRRAANWKTLSIPRAGSVEFNREFGKQAP